MDVGTSVAYVTDYVTPLGLFDRDGELRAKRLVVANLNALPRPTGPVADSDGDGAADEAERAAGTDPGRPDTDGDGLTDQVERLTGFDPLTPDAPLACQALAPSTRAASSISAGRVS